MVSLKTLFQFTIEVWHMVMVFLKQVLPKFVDDCVASQQVSNFILYEVDLAQPCKLAAHPVHRFVNCTKTIVRLYPVFSEQQIDK